MAYIHENVIVMQMNADEVPASICISSSLWLVECSAEQEASVSRVLLTLLSACLVSSLLPTRLTPKVALIGMGSDSYPMCQ